MSYSRELLVVGASYTEPHRHYHTLSHLNQMFFMARELGWSLTPTQQLAVFYHDLVYNPGDPNNESDSAEIARTWLTEEPELPGCSPRISEAGIGEVVEIILSTKDHVPRIKSAEQVIDLDLSILATSESDYERYTAAIRKEFVKYKDPEWAVGRSAFLSNMLAKPGERIFCTDVAHNNLGEIAVHNMECELHSLRRSM